MGFGDAIRSGFRNYITFSGRAARSEFWFWQLFVLLLSFAAGAVDGIAFGATSGLFGLVTSLVTFLPGIAVSVRRLHDRDMSGWWLLLCFIPLLGWAVLLFFFVTKGTEGANRFGPDPLGGIGDRDWDANMPAQGFHRTNIPRVERKD